MTCPTPTPLDAAQELRQQSRRYLRFLLGWGLLCVIVAFAHGAVTGSLPAKFWAFRCASDGYSPDHYLGYCADAGYGSYEHQALYYPSEPAVVPHLKAAQVLFLGNSRAKIVFSTNSLIERFKAAGLAFYNLTFAGEFDTFPMAIIERFDLRPKVVVVNTDYFFYGQVQVFARPILSGDREPEIESRLKKFMQDRHVALCRDPKSALGGILCEDQPSQYRDIRNGAVTYVNWPNQDQNDIQPGAEFPEKQYPYFRQQAEAFRDKLRDRGSRLVLTYVPASGVVPEVAARLAKDLNIPLVMPQVEGLKTYDSHHLHPHSAERWAAAFMDLFIPFYQGN
ncbi:hypothetical protein [Magnetospira sp. QH-2]|uniref:hypothetical protein n=1 Tax=Magnetospira sp. (strain QH-2) TaxID=1288970 RepID=UPI0003E815A6|nr:hypothetical protein [Magnetospira sp. QH-2]CCQ75484.1 protein of unknown function [Magnetospira sp. QH-2]